LLVALHLAVLACTVRLSEVFVQSSHGWIDSCLSAGREVDSVLEAEKLHRHPEK